MGFKPMLRCQQIRRSHASRWRWERSIFPFCLHFLTSFLSQWAAVLHAHLAKCHCVWCISVMCTRITQDYSQRSGYWNAIIMRWGMGKSEIYRAKVKDACEGNGTMPHCSHNQRSSITFWCWNSDALTIWNDLELNFRRGDNVQLVCWGVKPLLKSSESLW